MNKALDNSFYAFVLHFLRKHHNIVINAMRNTKLAICVCRMSIQIEKNTSG